MHTTIIIQVQIEVDISIQICGLNIKITGLGILGITRLSFLAFCGGMVFRFSEEFTLLADPCAPLSPGFSEFSSTIFKIDVDFLSRGTHLFSSYLEAPFV